MPTVSVDTGRQWVDSILTGWFPVVRAWWWKEDDDCDWLLHVELNSAEDPRVRRVPKELLQRCGQGDLPSRQTARASLQEIVLRTRDEQT